MVRCHINDSMMINGTSGMNNASPDMHHDTSHIKDFSMINDNGWCYVNDD